MSEDPEALLRPLGTLPSDIMEDWSSGRFESCLAKCDAILEGDTPHEIARIFRGRILSRRNDHEGAIACFRIVAEKVPVFYPVWDMLGESYLLTGEYERSHEAYRTSAALSPTRAAPWCGAAIALHRMEAKGAAVGILRMALSHVDAAQHAVVLYVEGLLEAENGNVDEAFMSFLRSELITPEEDLKEMIGEHIAALLLHNKS